MDNKQLLVFSGNPKAASTWLGGLFSGVAIETGLNFFYGQYAIPENHTKIKSCNYDMLISQSSNYNKLKELDKLYRCIHVIRDPRDVCVSSYFSYKLTHSVEGWPALKELRGKLVKQSFDEGMIEIIKFNEYFFKTLNEWNYNDDNVMELKYEEITISPEEYALQIFEFLGILDTEEERLNSQVIALYNRFAFRSRSVYNAIKWNQGKLSEKRIKAINHKLSFGKLAKGRKKGSENTKSHYRKGISGDWKNHFSKEVKEYFKKEYGALLIKLGYEKNYDW